MSTNNYAKNTDCRFYPVQCTQERLNSMQPEEGYLYFTTDTRKIFLGKQNQFIRMCENAELFYGHKPIVYENTGLTPNPNVNFMFEDVDNSNALSLNDLILNIGTDENPDGCFYRVIGFEDDEIATVRLTMRGSGGSGGGSSDTPDAPGTPSLTIMEYYPSGLTYAALTMDSVEIGVKPNSSEETNCIIRVECSFSKEPTNETEKFLIHENLTHAMKTFYYVNLSPYLDLIQSRKDNSTQISTVYMHITDMYGQTRTKSFTVRVIELNMTSTESSMLSESTGVCRYRMTPSGFAGLSSYEAVFEYYNTNNALAYRHTEPIKSSQFNSEVIFDLPQSQLQHGAYSMMVYLQGTIGTTKLHSNILSYTMIHYDENVGDPILGIKIPERIEQYAEFPITYVLEYGNSVKPFNLDIKLNGKVIAQEVVTSGQLNTYYLTMEQMGSFAFCFDLNPVFVGFPTDIIIIYFYNQQ